MKKHPSFPLFLPRIKRKKLRDHNWKKKERKKRKNKKKKTNVNNKFIILITVLRNFIIVALKLRIKYNSRPSLLENKNPLRVHPTLPENLRNAFDVEINPFSTGRYRKKNFVREIANPPLPLSFATTNNVIIFRCVSSNVFRKKENKTDARSYRSRYEKWEKKGGGRRRKKKEKNRRKTRGKGKRVARDLILSSERSIPLPVLASTTK